MSLINRLLATVFPVRFLKPRPTSGAQPLAFQLLSSESVWLDHDSLQEALRQYHPELKKARCKIVRGAEPGRSSTVTIGWGDHVLELKVYDQPLPQETVEHCLRSEIYSDEHKAAARKHQTHMVLYYRGYSPKPLEHFVALALITGMLKSFDVQVALNEVAGTSILTRAINKDQVEADIIKVLRALPLPLFYCGFEIEEEEDGCQVYSRGAHRLEITDLAVKVSGKAEAGRFFDVFDTLLAYQISYPNEVKPGLQLQISDDEIVEFTGTDHDNRLLMLVKSAENKPD